MAKLKNVTQDELDAAEIEINTGGLWDIANRIEKMYCDDLKDPAQTAQRFLSISRAAADVASKILSKAQMQEQRRELEALRAEHSK